MGGWPVYTCQIGLSDRVACLYLSDRSKWEGSLSICTCQIFLSGREPVYTCQIGLSGRVAFLYLSDRLEWDGGLSLLIRYS